MQPKHGGQAQVVLEAVVRVSVVKAVRRDLREFAKLEPAVKGSYQEALALELAFLLDDPKNSATSKSLCAARLAETMEGLRRLLPEVREQDPLDEIAARRDARRADAKR